MSVAEPVIRPRSDTDTTPAWGGVGQARRARTVRRALLAVFGTVLALGALGMLGVREATARASGGGYDLTVTYPRITRPGHAVPLAIVVRRAGGFGDRPVTVRMTAAYFATFDENGVMPAASKETATGTDLVWEFDPPPGDTLRVLFDTRTGPNRQRGESATVAVVADGADAVSVGVRTWVLP